MPTIRVDDISVYYEIHGQGEPLLLINGLGAELSEFRFLVEQLAKEHKVVAFDNRGSGQSDKPDIPYTIAMMAEDSACLLQSLGVAKADVIGISLGGRIALELTLSHPELVHRLVLVSTSARVNRTWLGYLVFDVIHRLPLLRGKQPRYAFNRQREASSSYDCTDRLSEVKAKTLILGGRKDRFSPIRLQEELHVGIAASEMRTFDGGHLFFMMRERQNFLDAAVSWLRGPSRDAMESDGG